MVDWYGDEVKARLMSLVVVRMKLATVFLQGEIRKAINIGNRRGDYPSEPGEPPHKVTGTLQRSVSTSVVADANSVLGIVGTNLIYARRLELGFVGTDSLGRTIIQEPRPFIRPELARNKSRVLEIIQTGR